MATAAQVAEYRANNANLIILVRNDMQAFWDALNLNGSPLLVRDALLDFFPELITAYGDTSAVLAADFYDQTRGLQPSSTRFRALLSDTPDLEQSLASARWGLGALFTPEPDPALAFANLMGAAQRLVLQAGRTTTITSASRDPVRTGFARIPVGATCRFCTQIASRGFVFGSSISAGDSNSWHDDCDCVVVAANSKDARPEGYDPAEYLRLYTEGLGIS